MPTPIEIGFQVVEGGKVLLKWAGNTGPVTIYRTSMIIGTYQEKTDWTAEETLGALITTGELLDDSPLEYNVYYVTDGTNWGMTERFSTDEYAPVFDPDYQTASMVKTTAQDSFRTAVNNAGSVKFNPLEMEYVSGENGFALVALTGPEEELNEQYIGAVIGASMTCKFNILQTGTVQPPSAVGQGYTAKLSGSTQIRYTA